MYSFTVNGQPMVASQDISLLAYLREHCDLTSVKNGCGEGACGACMILADGKAVRACLLTTAKAAGKAIITVEGLSAREKAIYAWAFGNAGAVQCGFCTPGMVISAKALLDCNPEPTAAEIKKALRGNICRCTGYVKIVRAVELAASALRGEAETQIYPGQNIGQNMERVDAAEKTLGTGLYADDLKEENMLHGAVLRSRYPRAIVKSINIEKALLLPGVAAVMTAEDIPGERYWGYLVKDWPTLVAEGEETRYVGDALALIAASTPDIARQALKSIQVEYQELTPVISPDQALSPDAPCIHPGGNLLSTTMLKRGDAEAAIAASAHVVTQVYKTPFTEHAFLEPESAFAVPQPDGTIVVHAGSQSVYKDQYGIAAILGLPTEKVRVIGRYIGGAFGGKEDLSVQHHAALLAWKTSRPVKLTLSRQESLQVHPKRHAMEIEVTTACDSAGKLTVIRARVKADTGAYASLGGPVLQRACTHMAGPYAVANVDISGSAIYTNNPPAGAFRGFGVPQAAFASELNMNLLAEKVGISPWQIRYINALEPGLVMASGQVADESTAIKETLLAVKDEFEAARYAGIACAIKNTGIGVGVPDIARVNIRIQEDVVEVLTSAACLGQGLATIITQIVAETSGLEAARIIVAAPDTFRTPDAGTTTASRQTMFTGEAARQAALRLKEALASHSLAELAGREYYGEYSGTTDPLNSTKANPVNHVAYGYATQIVILNDQGMVEKVIAAHDVGRAINPQAVEGQVEGAVAMGLGYALREDFPLVNGVPLAKFGTLGLFRSTEMPEVAVKIIERNPSALAYGAKGVGEIATIPTAPAAAAAYYSYDKLVRTSLPLINTPYRKQVVK